VQFHGITFTRDGAGRGGAVQGEQALQLPRPVLNQYPSATLGSSVHAARYKNSYAQQKGLH
jgi:hypothetical protein